MTPFMALANHKNSETWKFEFSINESDNDWIESSNSHDWSDEICGFVNDILTHQHCHWKYILKKIRKEKYKKLKTFLCLALSSLETLAFSFMMIWMRWSRNQGARERMTKKIEGQIGLLTFFLSPLSLGCDIKMQEEEEEIRGRERTEISLWILPYMAKKPL